MSLPAIIILSILCTVAESSCPRSCTCDDSSVVCVNKSLKKVPDLEELTEEPMIIDLSGNRISLIDDNDFSFMMNNGVKEIYLNNSEVLDIDSAAFEELQNLQELYLGNNLLADIPEDIIEELPNMIVLDLSSNYFLGNMPLIKSKSLRVLALANAKISVVPENALRYLPSITILILQTNNIKNINPIVFQYVAAESFSVKLSYNSWECSCENFELFELLESKRYISTTDPLSCIENSNGMHPVFEVAYVEKMKSQCLKGNVLNDDDNAVKRNLLQMNESSYSLIKNKDNPPTVHVEDKINATYSNTVKKDVPAIQINKFEEVTTETSKNCQQGDETVQVFHMKYHIELMVILSIFAVGLFLGCFLNQFFTLSKYTKLKQSDISLYT